MQQHTEHSSTAAAAHRSEAQEGMMAMYRSGACVVRCECDSHEVWRRPVAASQRTVAAGSCRQPSDPVEGTRGKQEKQHRRSK